MKQVFIVFLILFNIACHEEKKSKEEEKNPEIYPVSSFFRDEIKAVDSLRLPTVMVTTMNNRSDTTLISMDTFRTMANEFLLSDISDPSLSRHYKESSFADQSIPSISFSYAALDKDLEIRRMDIILQPNPMGNDKVKTVYIEKVNRNKDTIINKKLYWKSGNNFQIIISSQLKKQPEKITQVKVSWNGFD
jgi:hypothetical protein